MREKRDTSRFGPGVKKILHLKGRILIYQIKEKDLDNGVGFSQLISHQGKQGSGTGFNVYFYLYLRCWDSLDTIEVVYNPAGSICLGNAAFSRFETHSSFQFLGVNLSVIDLKASYAPISI